jgi:hypothetical protein
MSKYLKQHYGPAEGPLGFPMPDKAAQALDRLLAQLPKSDEYAYRKSVITRGVSELLPGERADVSWISTEDIDRAGDIVLAGGMDDSHYQNNPIVTLQHAYWMRPVGRSLWRKRVRDGGRFGVKAKTHFPARPEAWPADDWLPDRVFALIQADLMRGKSIGFLPLKLRNPTEEEVRQRPDWAGVRLVIERWLLLEYACCYLPCNQNAVVEAVGKGLLDGELARALAIDLPPALPAVVPFTALAEVEKALARAVESFRPLELAGKIAQSRIDTSKGHI